MLNTMKSLGIDQLSREERLTLVQELWDTIAKEQQTPLIDEAQRNELSRRVAEDDATPDLVVAWEMVKAQALRQLAPQ